MATMMFLMIPYGAAIAYSSILAGEKGLTSYLPYFYICLVAGMLLSKLSTQKHIDAGSHRVLVCASLGVLVLTMVSFLYLNTGVHLLAAGFFFGLGYGILQPLFQSFVTGTTPAPQRGAANSTYMLSYDIGIGIGSLLMGFLQEPVGLTAGFALTALFYLAGGRGVSALGGSVLSPAAAAGPGGLIAPAVFPVTIRIKRPKPSRLRPFAGRLSLFRLISAAFGMVVAKPTRNG